MRFDSKSGGAECQDRKQAGGWQQNLRRRVRIFPAELDILRPKVEVQS